MQVKHSLRMSKPLSGQIRPYSREKMLKNRFIWLKGHATISHMFWRTVWKFMDVCTISLVRKMTRTSWHERFREGLAKKDMSWSSAYKSSLQKVKGQKSAIFDGISWALLRNTVVLNGRLGRCLIHHISWAALNVIWAAKNNILRIKTGSRKTVSRVGQCPFATSNLASTQLSRWNHPVRFVAQAWRRSHAWNHVLQRPHEPEKTQLVTWSTQGNRKHKNQKKRWNAEGPQIQETKLRRCICWSIMVHLT